MKVKTLFWCSPGTYRWFLVLLLFQASILYILSFVESQNEDTIHNQLRRQVDFTQFDITGYVNFTGLQHRVKHKTSYTRHVGDLEVKILLENRTLCKGVKTVDLLFMVHTAPGNVEKRKAIRSTFANSTFYKKYVVRVIFLFGLGSPQVYIQQEHEQYGDVVQGNFSDAYRNLTYKGMMGLKWISDNCRNVKYVFKIDDDTYVDTFNFFSLFYHQTHDDIIMCRGFRNDTLPVLRQDTWSLNRYFLRHYIDYPWHSCSGYGVVISGSLVPKICKASLIMQYLWIDDVFVYGILPSLIGNLKRIEFVDKVYSTLHPSGISYCAIYTNCSMVVGIARPNQIYDIWDARHRKYISGNSITIQI